MPAKSNTLAILVAMVTASLATSALAQTGPPPTDSFASLGHCCVPGNGSPGCNESVCESLVCDGTATLTGDPFCCTDTWDCVCADEAADRCVDLCTAGENDCCFSRQGVGCSDIPCRDTICDQANDPVCCNDFWDCQCVQGTNGVGGARDLCGDLCNVVGDCAIDFVLNLDDFAGFLLCRTGPGGGPISDHCTCADFDNDGDVDLIDWAELQRLLSGA